MPSPGPGKIVRVSLSFWIRGLRGVKINTLNGAGFEASPDFLVCAALVGPPHSWPRAALRGSLARSGRGIAARAPTHEAERICRRVGTPPTSGRGAPGAGRKFSGSRAISGCHCHVSTSLASPGGPPGGVGRQAAPGSTAPTERQSPGRVASFAPRRGSARMARPRLDGPPRGGPDLPPFWHRVPSRARPQAPSGVARLDRRPTLCRRHDPGWLRVFADAVPLPSLRPPRTDASPFLRRAPQRRGRGEQGGPPRPRLDHDISHAELKPEIFWPTVLERDR
jgi:hypothetical protein